MSVRDSLTRFRPESLFLWAFFLALTVVGVWVSAVAQRAHEQRSAVGALKDFDPRASVSYDYELDAEGNPIPGGRPLAPEWLRKIFGIDFFCKVVRLDVNGVTNERLADIAKLRRLKVLNLSLAKAGAKDANAGEVLRELPDLKRLSLQFGDRFRRYGANDKLLEQIGTMVDLQELTIELGESATPAGVNRLANLHALRQLRLIGYYGCEISSLDELGSLKQITSMEIDCLPALTGAALSFLADLPVLRSVRFDRCSELSIGELPVLKMVEEFDFEDCRPISDADLEYLARFVGICQLKLYCPIQTEGMPSITFSDRGLEALGKLTKLESLWLNSYDNSRVTAGAAEGLKRAHPTLRVEM